MCVNLRTLPPIFVNLEQMAKDWPLTFFSLFWILDLTLTVLKGPVSDVYAGVSKISFCVWLILV